MLPSAKSERLERSRVPEGAGEAGAPAVQRSGLEVFVPTRLGRSHADASRSDEAEAE
jgi:hypothetical protein